MAHARLMSISSNFYC